MAEKGEQAIYNFLHGLVVSVVVGGSLHTISKSLVANATSYKSQAKEGSCISSLIDLVLFDNEETEKGDGPKRTTEKVDESNKSAMFRFISDSPQIQRAVHLLCCATGLIVAFLIYGVQQEKIMTSEYNGEPFRNPNFLIFSNRFLAMWIAIGVCYSQGILRTDCALYKFSFCSISNILSSFCQFASLQFLSFPVLQVAKSCKALAVLVVSFIILGKQFPAFEYGVAVVVMAGAGSFFYIYAVTTKGSGEPTNWSVGLLFLTAFILLDGFTNVWQGHLNKKYKTSQWQMMFGVNTFSMLLTLLIQGTDNSLLETIFRILGTPALLADVLILCTSAVIGQLFIFHTIAVFGPLVFTLISICRVILSIVTSCILYGHTIVPIGWLSIAVVFGAMGWRAKKKSEARNKSKPAPVEMSIQTKTENNSA
eukprot:CAMPEP_0114513620 /NCGR_PEP_ID=MMETSP0109-20121206/15686_1 /TAXON_ID=29199 /ORGANISM="Chlorarachnion reptans, Strain CCCM449" /LENGTH=423 /DNA_ID=CAMNT_0001693543 /DNA_START=96 /DNA_END=1367 /DNA_ORIENTATION=+